jgi:hypothetical protein
MARIAKCPHCKKPIAGGPDSPSALKRKAEAEAAAERRHRREIESEVRRWYSADFKIIYDAVARTKIGHARHPEKMSNTLYNSILSNHAASIAKLEAEIEAKVLSRLKK